MNADMLKQRLKILNEIDALIFKCNCVRAEEIQECPNCKQLCKYGEKLMKLVGKRKVIKIKSNKKLGRKPKITMTKDEYLDLRNASKTDKEIAVMINVSHQAIKYWKKKNGIITKNNLRRRKEIS